MPKKKLLHPGSGNDKSAIMKGEKGGGETLSLYLDQRTGEMAVKVIDTKTLEVIKEISPQELMDIKDRIDEMAGSLLNNKKT